MNWFIKLFGRQIKQDSQEEAKTRPSSTVPPAATESAKKISAPSKVKQPDCIA